MTTKLTHTVQLLTEQANLEMAITKIIAAHTQGRDVRLAVGLLCQYYGGDRVLSTFFSRLCRTAYLKESMNDRNHD